MSTRKHLKIGTKLVFTVISEEVELSGFVIGNLWGGGLASYPAETVSAPSMSEARNKAQEMLESGALDSGMGFEELTGAKLTTKHTVTLMCEGSSPKKATCVGRFHGQDQRLFSPSCEGSHLRVTKAFMGR